MAKELPYFKFFCSEWTDGDVTLENYEIQGLFINICSYYWSNECDVTLSKLRKKFRGNDESINEILKSGLIKHKSNTSSTDLININFLDEQQEERVGKSKIKSKAGKASAEARRKKKEEELLGKDSTEVEHVLDLCSTEVQLLREEEIREEKRRKELEELNKVKTLDFDKLLFFIKQETRREFRTINKSVQNKYKARLRDGYLKADIQNAIKYACSMQYHKDNGFQYLTPEFFSRADTLDKYGSKSTNEVKTNHNLNPAN